MMHVMPLQTRTRGFKSLARILIEPLEPRRLLAGVGEPYDYPITPRQEVSLNASWKFQKGDTAGAAGAAFDDSKWSSVSVPHTWNASDGADGGNDYYRGISWYRHRYTIPASASGKAFVLKFDGVTTTADVYVNGQYAGNHKGGYAAFAFDISTHVKVGSENVIAVKVNNANDPNMVPVLPPPNKSLDFTVFGGIYRDVKLLVLNRLQVSPLDHASPGLYLTQSKVSRTSAELKLTTVLRNAGELTRNATVTSYVVDAAGIIVAKLSDSLTLAGRTAQHVTQQTIIRNPRLWDGTADPYRYRVYAHVSEPTGLTDVVSQPLGFRYFEVNANTGFHLNGRPLDLRGVNMHQDQLGKGYATSPEDRKQDVALVRELGATGVRLAHYQHHEQTYQLLDEQGLIAWSELPLAQGITDSSAFLENAKQQLRELIRQNYNHPSIFFWGLYNEIPGDSLSERTVKELHALARAEDPTRPTTGASNLEGTPALHLATDLLAFNKYFGWYQGVFSDLGPWLDGQRAKYPGRPLAMSEYGAGASIFHHQDPPTQPVHNGAFHPEEWQNELHEATWPQLKARPWLWAKFIWLLADFASDERSEGDTLGCNDKGLVTHDRQTKKDAFHYYKANWSSEPVLYLTSHRFVERTSDSVNVKVYSNFDAVTLAVNQVTIGTSTSGQNAVFKWSNVQLRPGANTITVSGTRGGKIYSESAVWNYTPPLPGIRINFQPATAPPYGTYLLDTGAVFGDRGNGFSYGWNAINNNTRDRDASISLDQRYDTLNHMQRLDTYTWEIAVPNGSYNVKIVAGDASFWDSVYRIAAEGVLVVNGTPTSANRWIEGNATITVSDGRLTLTNASGAANNKIAFIEIVPASPPLAKTAGLRTDDLEELDLFDG